MYTIDIRSAGATCTAGTGPEPAAVTSAYEPTRTTDGTPTGGCSSSVISSRSSSSVESIGAIASSAAASTTSADALQSASW